MAVDDPFAGRIEPDLRSSRVRRRRRARSARSCVDVELRRPRARLRAPRSTSRSPGAAPAQTGDCGSAHAGPRRQAQLHGTRATLDRARTARSSRGALGRRHQRAARRPSPGPAAASSCARRRAQLRPSSAHDRGRAPGARPRRDGRAGPAHVARPRCFPERRRRARSPATSVVEVRGRGRRPSALQSRAARRSPGVEGAYVRARHDACPEEDHSTCRTSLGDAAPQSSW